MQSVALVTGCSSGIGQEIANNLLNMGWKVIGVSRRSPTIDHEAFEHMLVDLSDIVQSERQFEAITKVDAIVHAAGILRVGRHTEMDLDDGELMWRTHVQAAAILMRNLTPKMPDGGRIVLIGSRVAEGAQEKSLYAASKAAYVGLARSVAMELANRAVTVNIVSPAATDTPMLKDPNRAATQPALPPFGRLIQPSEIAGTVQFLLSESAASITGQNIIVCAGASL
ncbi:Short-chain dehydrogenase/reductase [Vibrio nigripulchritudo SOn1]|uniref:Short-chain dehydrogenase/reductase n=1 Tax=Vibrio nigripulchritudo SOn1 TaxID=1238450 RepID=A0AAV2VZW0_9VIBR|nr:SDR family oxidoreductase [Vibrio nigripulchritudo]CCO50306.1 Short-chain dehydrogenase/reductase [Vibrio nigripulchritudo SOn1]